MGRGQADSGESFNPLYGDRDPEVGAGSPLRDVEGPTTIERNVKKVREILGLSADDVDPVSKPLLLLGDAGSANGLNLYVSDQWDSVPEEELEKTLKENLVEDGVNPLPFFAVDLSKHEMHIHIISYSETEGVRLYDSWLLDSPDIYHNLTDWLNDN